MSDKTREYLERANEMSDEELNLELNCLIRREEILRKRYSQLDSIIDKQCVRFGFFNSTFKRATDLRKKVCSELNPIIDITNNFYGLLHERGLEFEYTGVTYRLGYQMKLFNALK